MISSDLLQANRFNRALNSHLRLRCSVVAAMLIEVSVCRWLSACLLAPLTLSLVAFSGLLAAFQRYDTHRYSKTSAVKIFLRYSDSPHNTYFMTRKKVVLYETRVVQVNQ